MHDVHPDAFSERVDTYAGWVRELRTSTKLSLPEPDPADPLLALGQELRLLAETMEIREREMLRLFDLVHGALEGVTLEDVLNEIYQRFSGVIPYDRISCAFLSEDGTYLTASWAASKLPGDRVQAGYTQPMAGSSLMDVIATGQPRIINDLAAYAATKPDSDSTRRIVAEGGGSSLTCPLFVDGKPTGFLFFTSAQPNAYFESHQSIFCQIAGQISLVIHRSRTHAEVIRQNGYLANKARELQEFCQLIMHGTYSSGPKANAEAGMRR
jgi:GAF domain-containing protein